MTKEKASKMLNYYSLVSEDLPKKNNAVQGWTNVLLPF